MDLYGNKAVLVGINNYPGTGSDLDGCLPDIAATREILKSRYGFSNNAIHVLLDDGATVAAVTQRMLQWPQPCPERGWCVVHYSGHGTTFRGRDPNGNLLDSTREALVLYDGLLDDAALPVLMNALPRWWTGDLILDSCFSAGMVERAIHYGKPRFMPAPWGIAERLAGEEALIRVATRMADATAEHGQWRVWLACGEGQTSADSEFDDGYHGAFSYFLQRALRDMPDWSCEKLLIQAALDLQDNNYRQRPSLRGPAELQAEPFGAEQRRRIIVEATAP